MSISEKLVLLNQDIESAEAKIIEKVIFKRKYV